MVARMLDLMSANEAAAQTLRAELRAAEFGAMLCGTKLQLLNQTCDRLESEKEGLAHQVLALQRRTTAKECLSQRQAKDRGAFLLTQLETVRML